MTGVAPPPRIPGSPSLNMVFSSRDRDCYECTGPGHTPPTKKLWKEFRVSTAMFNKIPGKLTCPGKVVRCVDVMRLIWSPCLKFKGFDSTYNISGTFYADGYCKR